MPDNREELKVYRLEMAKERLHSSKILLEAGSYKDSIGRSYYAMFTAVRALLAVEGQDFSKHAGVIAYFQKEYVKTGKFDKKYSKWLLLIAVFLYTGYGKVLNLKMKNGLNFEIPVNGMTEDVEAEMFGSIFEHETCVCKNVA